MYSGLLPPGLTEADLSSEDDGDVTAGNRPAETETNEHLSRQSSTETRPSCVQLESNVNRTTDLQTDALCDDDCPPGVSLDKWQRFKELQRAKADQRVKQPQTKRLRKRRHKKRGTQTQNDDTEQKRKLEEKEENWKELTQYFGMKDKFEPPPCNRPPPKSGLEKSIESAIAEGDYGTAEELSDRLATREGLNECVAHTGAEVFLMCRLVNNSAVCLRCSALAPLRLKKGQGNLYRLNASLQGSEDLHHYPNLWHQVQTKGINLAKC
ncbi:protein FAM204A isoform X2 [Misgurnus anguillicaudatus]|uniref:protein FAM204A isoform X2 n=1 Tax=Misgurnus anguillicaudatus TaxID=75329 RepID=UPI003CCF8FF2